jgi:hypothetical protein
LITYCNSSNFLCGWEVIAVTEQSSGGLWRACLGYVAFCGEEFGHEDCSTSGTADGIVREGYELPFVFAQLAQTPHTDTHAIFAVTVKAVSAGDSLLQNSV